MKSKIRNELSKPNSMSTNENAEGKREFKDLTNTQHAKQKNDYNKGMSKQLYGKKKSPPTQKKNVFEKIRGRESKKLDIEDTNLLVAFERVKDLIRKVKEINSIQLNNAIQHRRVSTVPNAEALLAQEETKEDEQHQEVQNEHDES